jgi:hypothetical protein
LRDNAVLNAAQLPLGVQTGVGELRDQAPSTIDTGLYDLSGRSVAQPHVPGRPSHELRPGIYVRNRRKIVVR